jgi:hypothetical protein
MSSLASGNDPTHGVGSSRVHVQVPGPERNIYGRYGKLFLQEVDVERDQDEHYGKFQWLANTTAIKASAVFDKQEVKSAGDVIVRYKQGAFTGEGSVTIDKVNSYFESFFINHLRRAINGVEMYNMPRFFLTISLEDLGGAMKQNIPGVYGPSTPAPHNPYNPNNFNASNEYYIGKEPHGNHPWMYDEYGFAVYGHEQIILQNVQFWSIPLGYSTDEMITQDLEFTFQGMIFGGGGTYRIDDFNYKFPDRVC